MRVIVSACLAMLLYSCGTQKITTAWKAAPGPPDRYQKILVVAILPASDSIERKIIETSAVRLLAGYGYDAVSAISEFGPKGIAAANEEATYLKLCNNGIDAVMTFALVPMAQDVYYPAAGQYLHPNNYYYDRIWKYKKMQSVIVDCPDDEYFLESIFFDLFTLQTVSTLRTRNFAEYVSKKHEIEVADLVIKKMLKEKIIRKKSRSLKAF